MRTPRHRQNQGFTLIELSVVLVIVGLLVAGILIGQDMIKAAELRATLAQIEKYNTAANTFKVKYGYLPGDIPDPYASQFGFVARGPDIGEGNGDGLIEGQISAGSPNNFGTAVGGGETGVFWRDLSSANLVDGSFSVAISTGLASSITLTTTPNISNYLPNTKIGNGNYIYAYSGGHQKGGGAWATNGINYFGISAVTVLGNGAPKTDPALTVAQAYNIDKKIDDGYPQTGSVTAQYLDYTRAGSLSGGYTLDPIWAAGGSSTGTTDTSATPSSASTCYDNGGVAGTQQYSMEIGNGSNTNCALSFVMQGAAR
jgi:prepilin-type N-terminal cleavage/methylation domain-containing protein